MFIKKYSFTLILLLCAAVSSYSQETRREFRVDFRVNTSAIDSTYSDNAVNLRELSDFLNEIRLDTNLVVKHVSLYGAASPDGSDRYNRKLAQERLAALESLLLGTISLEDGLIHKHADSYIQWDYLKAEVDSSEVLAKDKVISVLSDADSRVEKLKKMDGGKVWSQINMLFFKRMRNARVVFVTDRRKFPEISELTSLADTLSTESEKDLLLALPDMSVNQDSATSESDQWNHRLHVKTNVLGLGLAIANLGVEVDLARHWSLSLPLYYSAWDYFKSTVKFRTFAVQPELRYWFSEDNDRFFVGAHFGLVSYNLAFGGDYRYQDHYMKTPSLGGGIGLGYRLPIGSSHWHVEFSVGAGVYSRHYDKFFNTPSTKDGLLTESIRKTYWGIDQASVSFSYSFDLKKKGERR